MAESDEHRFVTSTFLELTQDLSRSRVYGYQEADRKIFDFACVLASNYERQLVGQTLRSHPDGIEKDLNTLLLGQTSEISLLLYSDSAKNVARIHEVLARARRTVPDEVARLRLFSYPANFDADDEDQRAAVRTSLEERVVDDLLLNVVLGNLLSNDIAVFLDSTSRHNPGLLLALLERIAVDLWPTATDLGRQFKDTAGVGSIRRRLQALFMCGMIERPLQRSVRPYRISHRGWTLLRLCKLLSEKTITAELAFIVGRLGIGPERHVLMNDSRARRPYQPILNHVDTPEFRRWLLDYEVAMAIETYGVEFDEASYILGLEVDQYSTWIGR
jgi:hypothetical protein